MTDIFSSDDTSTPFLVLPKLFEDKQLNKVTDLSDGQIAEMTKFVYFLTALNKNNKFEDCSLNTLKFLKEISISRDRGTWKSIEIMLKNYETQQHEDKNKLGLQK